MRRGFVQITDTNHIKERKLTKTRIDSLHFSFSILRAFAIGWQSLCFVLITLLLPQSLIPLGLFALGIGLYVTAIAVLKERPRWVAFSLLDVGITFLVLLASDAAGGTLESSLPSTLLLFVMILFAVEVLTAGRWYRRPPSTAIIPAGFAESDEVLQKSVKYSFQHISRTGMFFASTFLVSIGILYLSAAVSVSTSLLADVSLYIVVVSIALALLIFSREE